MASQDLIRRLVTDGPVNIASASGRRVRALFNGHYILDTLDASHVWEHPYYPQFYVPFSSWSGNPNLKVEKVQPIEHDGSKVASTLRIIVGDRSIDDAFYFEDLLACGKLAGLSKIPFEAIDQWFEEDVPVYVHPKDPTKRIDILPSSREIEVLVNGQVVAKTTSAYHLIEPLLPVRYYLPPTSVDQSVLRPSKTRSRCPYKGEAEYYDVVVGGETFSDLIWWYRYPTPESVVIAGHLCFYNEKVDVVLDGRQLVRPKSKFA